MPVVFLLVSSLLPHHLSPCLCFVKHIKFLKKVIPKLANMLRVTFIWVLSREPSTQPAPPRVVIHWTTYAHLLTYSSDLRTIPVLITGFHIIGSTGFPVTPVLWNVVKQVWMKHHILIQHKPSSSTLVKFWDFPCQCLGHEALDDISVLTEIKQF